MHLCYIITLPLYTQSPVSFVHIKLVNFVRYVVTIKRIILLNFWQLSVYSCKFTSINMSIKLFLSLKINKYVHKTFFIVKKKEEGKKQYIPSSTDFAPGEGKRGVKFVN